MSPGRHTVRLFAAINHDAMALAEAAMPNDIPLGWMQSGGGSMHTCLIFAMTQLTGDANKCT